MEILDLGPLLPNPIKAGSMEYDDIINSRDLRVYTVNMTTTVMEK